MLFEIGDALINLVWTLLVLSMKFSNEINTEVIDKVTGYIMNYEEIYR